MPAYLNQILHITLQLAAFAALFVPLEYFFSQRRDKPLRPQLGNDLAYYVLNSVLPGALLALPLAGLVWSARHLVPGALVDAMASLPFWLRLPLALVIGDIGAYWGHRWSHKLKFLWGFHAIHHSATRVDWLVNTRAHPVDLIFTRICGLVPLFALGLAQTTTLPALYSLFALIWPTFIHANVPWRLGWLEQIIATPAFHHWHHSNDEWRDHNYAAIFPFIDRMFGSLHLPNHYPPVYGVDQPPDASLLGQLIDPLLPQRSNSQPS